jgi:hypothetical protein
MKNISAVVSGMVVTNASQLAEGGEGRGGEEGERTISTNGEQQNVNVEHEAHING